MGWDWNYNLLLVLESVAAETAQLLAVFSGESLHLAHVHLASTILKELLDEGDVADDGGGRSLFSHDFFSLLSVLADWEVIPTRGKAKHI